MNDLQILHDAWPVPEGPSYTSYTQARAALVERAGSGARPRQRRRLVRPALGVALALAIAGAVVVIEDLGSAGPDGIAVAEVLERAAVAAEDQPFTAPQDNEWIYTEDRLTSSDGGEPTITRSWKRADGRGHAFDRGDGEVHVAMFPGRKGGHRRPVPPLESYKTLAALPTDPDALLRWAYRLAENVTGAGVTEHGDVYAIFNGMMRGNVLPPDLMAGIFRALKQVPGVTVRTVELFGRPALALSQTEDWLREELLLDSRTYEYRGERSTIVRNTRIDPLKAGNSTGEVKKGSWVIGERVATAVVDKPGERR